MTRPNKKQIMWICIAAATLSTCRGYYNAYSNFIDKSCNCGGCNGAAY